MKPLDDRLVHLSMVDAQILTRFAYGETYRAIAKRLYLSPATVAYHAGRIQRRLRVSSMTAAVALAIIAGVLTADTWPIEAAGILEIDLDALPHRRPGPS